MMQDHQTRCLKLNNNRTKADRCWWQSSEFLGSRLVDAGPGVTGYGLNLLEAVVNDTLPGDIPMIAVLILITRPPAIVLKLPNLIFG